MCFIYHKVISKGFGKEVQQWCIEEFLLKGFSTGWYSLNTCHQEKGITRRNRNTTNSFRLRSNNLQIMTIQWREQTQDGRFALYHTKASSTKLTDLRGMFKRPQSVSVPQMFWYLLIPFLLLHQLLQLWRLQKRQKWFSDDPKPAYDGNTQMEKSSNWLY